MHFSTCRPGKAIRNLQTIFGIRDYVGETYNFTNTPNLVEIGSRAAPLHSGEILRFCDFCSPFFYFSVSSSRLQVAIMNRFARFMAQKTCSVSYTCLFRVRSFQIHVYGASGGPAPKTPNFRPVFEWTANLQRKTPLALEPSRVNYP